MPRVVLCGLMASVFGACAPSRRAQRIERAELQQRLATLENPGLVIGEFALDKVLDGDTLRVGGLDQSLRLLGIDTEETFKSEADRRLFEAGWASYLTAKRGDSKHPVKMATPLGEEAKVFAKAFFDGGERGVRLERDDPRELRDVYGRYLAYAFAFRGGQWVNYNVECVRAGMSPYFSKYGYSRRFHDQLLAAEREAREARRGIWSDEGQHYPDYPERKAWWDARAEFVSQALAVGGERPDFVVLGHFDALWRLEKLEGREATVFGLVGEVTLGDKGPSRAVLTHKRRGGFPLVFFDKDVLAASQIGLYRGEFVSVRGVVSRYRRKDGGGSELQMVVKEPGQVVGRKVPGLRQLPVDDDGEPGDEP